MFILTDDGIHVSVYNNPDENHTLNEIVHMKLGYDLSYLIKPAAAFILHP